MAKVDTGNFSSVSGRKGDTVYCNTKYGTVARRYVKSSKKPTAAQLSENDKFEMIRKEYDTLTDIQHAKWVRLKGNTIVRSSNSGKEIKDMSHLFQSCNMNLLSVNEQILKDIMFFAYPQKAYEFTFEIKKETDRVELRLNLSTSIDEITKIAVYATKSAARGKRKFSDYDYKQIAVLDKDFINGDSIIDDYYDVFKTLPMENKRIGIRIKVVCILSGLADTFKEQNAVFECSENQSTENSSPRDTP